jgi:hypothetical protein
VFEEIYQEQRAVFVAKQLSLIESLGDGFAALISRIPKATGLNYGDPPFIVDEGNHALLLVAADGSWSRLPMELVLGEEMVKQGYDALYSVPVLGLGTVRFIPANPDFIFPLAVDVSNVPNESDSAFFKPLDSMFEAYVQRVTSLAQKAIVGKLVGMKEPLQALCLEEALAPEEVLRMPALAEKIIAIFARAVTDAAETAKVPQGEDGQLTRAKIE